MSSKTMRCPAGALVTRTSAFTPSRTVTREVVEEIPVREVEVRVPVTVDGKTYFRIEKKLEGEEKVEFVPVTVQVGGKDVELLEERRTIVPRKVTRTVSEKLPPAAASYSIDNEKGRRRGKEKKLPDGRRAFEYLTGRCQKKAKVERISETALEAVCPDCGKQTLNAAIWAKEAGL